MHSYSTSHLRFSVALFITFYYTMLFNVIQLEDKTKKQRGTPLLKG